jgi:outer membrane protein
MAQDLAAAIADALANAPVLAEANAGEAAAKARLDRARAESNPLLRVEGSYGAGRIDNGGFFGITADNVNPLALQATAELPLYAGGRVSSAIDQARGGAAMAHFGAEQARLQTIVTAVGTYTEVLTARKLEARYGQLVEELTETERQAGLRFRAGEIASSDLAQARARKAEADAGFAQAQGRRMSAEAAYQRLTGKPAGDLAPLAEPPAVPPTLDEAMDMARASNPRSARPRRASMSRGPAPVRHGPRACRRWVPLPKPGMCATSSSPATRPIRSPWASGAAGPCGRVGAYRRRSVPRMPISMPARPGCVRPNKGLRAW